ncbi:hypothetical protein SEA_LEOPARD_67 [Mycobacterium phage Leopard]|uniref:Uncharacterized protein n=1 Tax=Mycobacterium phage Onyinye TaxID=2686235 RepID=A0A6B9L9I6_9CAUD|nr:hypothetical protein PP339_gp068 [Mycobacterium phage Onyinye]QHB37473.1 hypothetical protein SEA_ONYINYE_68 [Mycobacterium phage Onyinye]UOW92944.1 hypothetical protein SEA_LEOPARD_67 [Mycobacterium phage Leopard]
MKALVPVVATAVAIGLAPVASAEPNWQHDVLCSSNMAYRNAHKDVCADYSIGSHGGNGGWGPKDADGDGEPNESDQKPYDGNVS